MSDCIVNEGWQLCGFCCFAIFFVAALTMLTKSLGKVAFAPLRNLVSQSSVATRIFLGGGLLIFGYVGGTKPAGGNGGGSNRPLMGMWHPLFGSHLVSSNTKGVEDYFPSATNAVTNLACVGIMNQATSLVFGVRWPNDALWATNGIDLYALADLTRSNETNAWRWLGRAPIAEGVNESLIALFDEVTPDAFGSQMFFTVGFALDVDGDGLTDAFERIVSRTDPENADTDGDGMPDGWEYENGLDPFSNDASDDTDGDGICNVDELGLGTSPTARDTDGDGLDDKIEIGGTNEVFMTEGLLTGGVVLTNLTTSAAFTSAGGVDCVDFAFPEPIELGGSAYEKMSLDPNGIVYLRPTGSTDAIPSCVFPDDYAKVLCRVQDYVLMPYWSRLNVQTSGLNASEVTVKLIDGCYVVTYKNMRFDPTGMTDLVDPSLQALIPLVVSLTPVSFQTIIAPANSTVEYRYQISGIAVGGLDSRNYAKGRLAAIGAKDRFAHSLSSIGFGKYDAVESDMGILMTLSSRTDPANADSDGDGMNDGEELKNNRDPKDNTDSADSDEVSLFLCFGDPSYTDSESYKVEIRPLASSIVGVQLPDTIIRETGCGEMYVDNVKLKKGWKYQVRLYHTGSTITDFDYDYVISFASSSENVIIDDQDGLMACHVYKDLTTSFPAYDKMATIIVNPDVTAKVHDKNSWVVLMEDAYTNRPGDVVAARATTTDVKVKVSGTGAGTMTLSFLSGSDKVNVYDSASCEGDPLTIPYSWTAYGGAERTFYAKGTAQSGSKDDVEFQFDYEDGDIAAANQSYLTAIKIKVEADANFPVNKTRHLFGVDEGVKIKFYPSDPVLGLVSPDNSNLRLNRVGGNCSFYMPARAFSFDLGVTYGGLNLEFPLSFEGIEPSALRVDSYDEMSDDDINLYNISVEDVEDRISPLSSTQVGEMMYVNLSVEPDYVSFMRVWIFEEEAEPTGLTGWFLSNPGMAIRHGVKQGAAADILNDAVCVGDMNFVTKDFAGYWLPEDVESHAGSYTLNIPVKWYSTQEKSDGNVNPVTLMTAVETFTLGENGSCTIEKFGVSKNRQIDQDAH